MIIRCIVDALNISASCICVLIALMTVWIDFVVEDSTCEYVFPTLGLIDAK